MTTRAVVYGRNSSAKQKSIRDQLSLCVAEVAGQGWTLVGEPLSDPSSASRYKTKERANWAQLLQMLPTVDVVVLWESSRGDRTLSSWASFLDSCRENGVRIHALSHHRTYDPRSARDYKTLAEDGVDSAYESDKISEKVRRGQEDSAKDGKPHSRTTFGYRRFYDPRTKEFERQDPHPDQAPIVRDIIISIGRGEPLRQIVQRLNQSGVPTHRDGSQWYHSTVRDIATNVAYRPHPDNAERGTRVHSGAEHMAQWKPLVTRAQFEAAGRVLGTNSEKARLHRRKSRPGAILYMLSGNPAVATAMCGSALHGFRATDGRTGTYGCKADSCASAPMGEVDEYVSRLVVARLSKRDARMLWVGDDSASKAAADQLAGLLRELEDARQSFARPGGISAAALAMKEAALADPVADARRRATPSTAPIGALEVIDAAKFGKEKARPAWDALPLLARREVIAAMFDQLSLKPATHRLTRWSTAEERMNVVMDRVEVRWRVP